jgi:uncharacterized protein (TIGR02996 family)
MTDDDFLRSIVAAPEDDFLRLAYADWLQEQGDPRGEFLRVEHELRSLPTVEPSHAQLQLRLKEFHRVLDPDWLGLVRRLSPLDGVDGALMELEELLAGCDYVVSLDLFRILIIEGGAPKDHARAALASSGERVDVRGCRPIPKAKMLEAVETCLRFHYGSVGPSQKVIRSLKLAHLIGRVREYLNRSYDESTAVMAIGFAGHHAFSGVMWDFAHLFVKARVAVVFIGWSSD